MNPFFSAISHTNWVVNLRANFPKISTSHASRVNVKIVRAECDCYFNCL